jgi:hypothetical protein
MFSKYKVVTQLPKFRNTINIFGSLITTIVGTSIDMGHYLKALSD